MHFDQIPIEEKPLYLSPHELDNPMERKLALEPLQAEPFSGYPFLESESPAQVQGE